VPGSIHAARLIDAIVRCRSRTKESVTTPPAVRRLSLAPGAHAQEALARNAEV